MDDHNYCTPDNKNPSEQVTSMDDHNYCTPSNKDPSEQQDHAGMDIVSKMEEDNVLLTLPENIAEAREQGMTLSMIDGVLQDMQMCEFSINIQPDCMDFVSSEKIQEHVKSVNYETNIKEFSYLPKCEEGFKMEGEPINEEFVNDGHFEELYSIELSDASDQEYVIYTQTEPDNENFVSTPQQFDEIIMMEESEATSAEFVSSLQFVDSVNDQSENTDETFVYRSQPLQAITKMNHGPQGDTVTMALGPSAMVNLDSEPEYTCNICGEVFNTQAVMAVHIAQFHTPKMLLKCNVCGKAFFKQSSLNKHNLTHIEKCGVCAQNVIWLSLHMLNHTGERPHRCCVCHKVFITVTNSNTGSSELISTNKKGFYDCDICGKEIAGRNYFTLHMKRHTLRQTHLTCVCRTTHGSSSDTKSVVTSTKERSLNYVKTCVNLKHNEKQGKTDVNNDQNACNFCDHQFQSRFELHLHLLTHFKGRVQDCNVCSHGFTSEELLLKHLIEHIESSMYDSCAYVTGVQKKKQSVILDKKTWGTAMICSSMQSLKESTVVGPRYEQPNGCGVSQKGINTNKNISEYLSTPIEEQPNKCAICDKVFIRKVHLSAHMLTHIIQRPHKCHVCGKDFAEKRLLEIHLLTHPGERPHQCGMCGVRFATKTNLERHTSTHTGEFPHKCSVCAKGFTWKVDLTRHMFYHTGERPHKCSLCRKGFVQKSSLTNHMLTHTGERPHKCGVCGKGFAQKSSLPSHMLTHTGERPHKCVVCGRGFTKTSHLTNHMLFHTGEFPHKCGLCGQGFTQKGHLKRHILTHTKAFPLKCGVCGKGFIETTSLRKHTLTHTGERPHKCGVCGRGFIQKANLTRHILTHTGERPNKCGVCGKEFRSKSNLSKHSFTHT